MRAVLRIGGLLLAAATVVTLGGAVAQAQVEERVIRAEYDAVWNATLEVLERTDPPGCPRPFCPKGWLDHPHGKAKLKKKRGKIKTPTFRFFRIESAGFPPIETDYQDMYKIRITLVEPEVKPEAAEASGPQADTTAGAVGSQAAAGVPAGDNAPPLPPQVTLKITRKFEVYDEAERKWKAGNPEKEAVGVSAQELADKIEARLAATSRP